MCFYNSIRHLGDPLLEQNMQTTIKNKYETQPESQTNTHSRTFWCVIMRIVQKMNESKYPPQ